MATKLVERLQTSLLSRCDAAIPAARNGRAFCVGADRAFLSGERGRNGLADREEHFIDGFRKASFSPTHAHYRSRSMERPSGMGCDDAAGGSICVLLSPAPNSGFPFATKLPDAVWHGSTAVAWSGPLLALSRAKDIPTERRDRYERQGTGTCLVSSDI